MSRPVHISEATSLALHSIAYIASKKKAVKLKEIAKELGASEAHLSKVLQWLVKADFILSARGPSGGFVMKKNSDEITLYEIFEIMEGPIEHEKCPLKRPKCPFNKCLFQDLIRDMSNDFKNYLESHTLKDFLRANKKEV